jgi:hypothetical protein
MRTLPGALIGLHGVIHAVGFVVPWRGIADELGGYPTTVFFDSIDLGTAGMRLYGVLWLLVGAALVIAGLALARHEDWSIPALAVASAVSLVMCVVSMPSSVFGLAADLVILGWLAVHTGLRRPTTRPALR